MIVSLVTSGFYQGLKNGVLNPNGAELNNIVRIVALTQLANMKVRIHQDGKAADGSAIGNYSTKPMYVSATSNIGNAKKFGAPVGKNGLSKFKSGKQKKSKYFEGGYNQFKTTIGRNQLGTVNLSLSGQLDKEFTLIATSKGWGLGWNDEKKLKRAKHLEKKYGKAIYQPTQEELEIISETAEFELKNAVS